MDMKWVLSPFLAAVSASMALGYTGATVSTCEADVTTSNLNVFPVPAAAGMAGARLVYDNSALLAFSSGYVNATDRNWLTMPLSSAGVTVNNISVTTNWAWTDPVQPTGVNNGLGITAGQYYTNVQESATDPRFPANIPRPGRDCDAAFSSFQFDLTNAASEFGVFISRNSNAWTYIDDWNIPTRNGQWLAIDPWGNPITPYPDDNNVLFTNEVFVAVLGETDTFATAQFASLNIQDGYAPFIKVAGNGTDLIKSVCVYQDAGWQAAPTFGFFDVYVKNPGDANGDGRADVSDLLTLAASYGLSQGQPGYNAACDFNGDNVVDGADLLILAGYFGTY